MNFKDKLINLKNTFIKALFPEDIKCILCNKDIPRQQYPFCESCQNDEIFNNGNRCKICDTSIIKGNIICDHCKEQKRFFEKCYCPLNYTKNVRKAILKFKSDNAKYLAKPFAEIIYKKLKNENVDFDLIVPVPSHYKTIKKRGYNPAKLLADNLSKLTEKPVVDILYKNILTKNQKLLNYTERQRNLQNSIILTDKNIIKNKNILLVDDVVTTCATVNICSQLLLSSAKNVFVCAIARNQI